MKQIFRALGATLLVAGIGLALAGPASAGVSAAEQRKVAMKALGGHMKAIGAVAKGKAAFSAAIPVHAQAINEMAQYMGLLFPAGSGGSETRAKPEIWSDGPGFAAKLEAFAGATPALVAAAKTGNAGAIGAALSKVGKNCGGCHKPFRVPKKK
jgi:cytochrome c556